MEDISLLNTVMPKAAYSDAPETILFRLYRAGVVGGREFNQLLGELDIPVVTGRR